MSPYLCFLKVFLFFLVCPRTIKYVEIYSLGVEISLEIELYPLETVLNRFLFVTKGSKVVWGILYVLYKMSVAFNFANASFLELIDFL